MNRILRDLDCGLLYGGFTELSLKQAKPVEFHGYHGVQNLDVPGVDHFTEYHGIFFTFQPNTRSLVPGVGRWVLTTSITNPANACVAYYHGAYWRIDQAIPDFINQVNNLH